MEARGNSDMVSQMTRITLTESDLLELRALIQEFRHKDAVAIISFIQQKEQRALREMSNSQMAALKEAAE